MITELNARSQAIMRYIVDAYLETGEPIGSRTISQKLGLNLSPASIRNVMADLESEGLLYAPHTSAGRLPTQEGMRFYVDGLMEIGDLTVEERRNIEAQCKTAGHSITQVLEQATTLLSGLSSAAGLVVAPKAEKPLKQMQFVQLDQRRILVILVMQDGLVENRIIETKDKIPPSSLIEAANYLNSRLAGRSLGEARKIIATDMSRNQAQLDRITAKLIERGLALEPQDSLNGHIIIRGQSRLLNDVKAIEDLEKAQQLMAALEDQQTMARLLESVQTADGVQIFIGTESKMFEHSGWSMVLAPYRTQEHKIIGAIGVIGPTRLNYSRIIPILDYTSKVMERVLGS